MPRRAILLFVKHPEPGRVKTRLAATVGPERAAAIYRQLVAEVVRRLPAGDELIVLFDPPEKRVEVAEWLQRLIAGRPVRFEPQARGDLGARLEAAFAGAFALGCGKIAAIGSDCIELTAAIFDEAWHALETHDAAIGPSADGGYYLLALRTPQPRLFVEMAWSTDVLFRQTLTRAADLGLRVHVLPKLHDVDTEDDWKRVAR